MADFYKRNVLRGIGIFNKIQDQKIESMLIVTFLVKISFVSNRFYCFLFNWTTTSIFQISYRF
jgi:hypothetical protein